MWFTIWKVRNVRGGAIGTIVLYQLNTCEHGQHREAYPTLLIATVEKTVWYFQKQNLPCPHIPTSDVFYKRQLWLYVMSVYSGKTSKSIMYTWPENIGKKGCNEVISVINHHIEAFVPETVKKLYIFTDSCRGQNQNQTVLKFWQALVLNGRYSEIKHHFPYRGHSFLPCDRHSRVIERMQRKEESVELPDDWVQIISSKFNVVQLNQLMIKDFAANLQEPNSKYSYSGGAIV